MKQTTSKASKNKNGNARNAVYKGKKTSLKTKGGNTSSDEATFSRQNAQNAKNGAQTAPKGKGKPIKQPNTPNRKGASGTKSGSATLKPKGKQVSFETNKPKGLPGGKKHAKTQR